MGPQSIDVKPHGSRPPISKSHSFGGYGPASAVHKGHHHHPSGPGGSGHRLQYGKQDSLQTSWRLSPSSSGYKTQSQSIQSDSVTPSPTGYESGGDQTPEPPTHAEDAAASSGATASASLSASGGACGVVWAVTDMASVPPGSVLIDPQTLQPIVNRDGSIYHFDPDNLPQTVRIMTTNLLHQLPQSVDEADEMAPMDDGDGERNAQSCTDDCTNTVEHCTVPECNAQPMAVYTADNMFVPPPPICTVGMVEATAGNVQNFDASCEVS